MTTDLEPPKELIEKWTAEFEKTCIGVFDKGPTGAYKHHVTYENHKWYIKGRTAGWVDLQRFTNIMGYAPPIRPGASPRMHRAKL